MSARDDFELVKRAVMFDADTDERCGFKDDAEATRKAFNRLFTPRPLRELVAEGWTAFWHRQSDKHPYTMLFIGQHHRWLNDNAIPILTPEDMGEG